MSVLFGLSAFSVPALAGRAETPVGYTLGGSPAPLLDPGLRAPTAVALGASGRSEEIPLPFAVEAPGGPFDRIAIDRDGSFELIRHASPLDPAAVLRVGEHSARGLPGARATFSVLAGLAPAGVEVKVVQARQGDVYVVRWLETWPGGRGRAVFEALLRSDGAVRYQYYVLPALPAGVAAGYSGLGGDLRIPIGRVAGGSAIELQRSFFEPLAPGRTAADCTICPATEAPWLLQLSQSGKICAPAWDANGDGVAELNGCSCQADVTDPSCTLNCGPNRPGILRSAPTTTVDTRWEFDEQAFCLDCPYTFYILIECGTEMHLPLDDMEGARLQITEVLTGTPVAITCQNDASKAPLFIDTCGPPTAAQTTRYFWPPYLADNHLDPTQPLEWGFADGCKTLNDLDANMDGVLQCVTELPINPGGSLNFADILPGYSPGDQQIMDCKIASPQGLCGVFRLTIASGGNYWNLFSNCTGDNSPNFRIFDSCSDACAAFNPLPELTVANPQITGCGASTGVSFDVSNIGCTDAPSFDYRIQSDCTPADVKMGTAAGLAANSTRTIGDSIAVSCSPPFSLTITVDPANAVAECSERPNAAKCAAIPGQDSVTLSASACSCVATVTPDASSGAPGWCQGGTAPTLTAAGSTATNCASGQLEYRWWKDAVGTGSPLTPFQADPTFVPGAEAAVGPNTYVVEVRCVNETCAHPASVVVTEMAAPIADPGPNQNVCQTQSVRLGTPAVGGLTYDWSPPTNLDFTNIAQPTLSTTGSTPLGQTTYTLTVTDPVSGCVSTATVIVEVVSGAPTGMIGNNLHAARRGADVFLEWRGGPLSPRSYNAHRESSKLQLEPPPDPPIGSNATDEIYTDRTAASPMPVYFYQVYGRDCSGMSIFN